MLPCIRRRSWFTRIALRIRMRLIAAKLEAIDEDIRVLFAGVAIAQRRHDELSRCLGDLRSQRASERMV